MANHKSAQKRIRRNDRRKVINGNRVGRIRTFVKKVMVALESGDKVAAETAYKTAQPEIMRGVSKGLINKNTAARQMSRMSQKIKALAS